jgi:hypothetical protein
MVDQPSEPVPPEPVAPPAAPTAPPEPAQANAVAPSDVPAATPPPSPPPTDKLTKALEFFKDWTNYLLITTVAAIGWTAAEKGMIANHPKLKFFCLAALGLSALFGILTLALVPLVQEQRKDETSNYDARVTFWLWPWPPSDPPDWRNGMRLTWVCFPQHVFLIIGIALYVYAAWPKW